jgi:hypothetical protein
VPETDKVGIGLTVTDADAVAVPQVLVVVTVYVPELEKVLAAVLGLLPPDHAYVPPAAPDAVRLTVPQAVVVPDIEAVGALFTVTDADAVAVQPLLVAVTV